MSSDPIDAESNISTLLNHQTHRLEDIANNAVDFIKINLLVLGAFAPFIATTFQAELSTSDLLESTYIQLATVSWTLSTFLTTGVYRVSRDRSTSQFELLEEAIVSDWREPDLRDEMLDNTSQYDQLVGRLMILLSVGIAASLVAVLYFALGIGDVLFEFPKNFKDFSIWVVLVVGGLVGIGWEVKRGYSYAILSRRWIFKNIASIVPQADAIKFDLTNNRGPEAEYNDVLEYLLKSEGLPPIRARLLKLIHSYADYRPWRFDELSSKIKDDETDIGVTRPMIERLVEDGYLRKIHPKGPSSYIIRTRDEEIVNGQDLDKTVGDELRRLIGFLESSDTAITVAADVLGTARNLEDVKSELTSGPIFNRIDKLGTVVDRLKDDPQVNIEQQDLGKIIIRNQTATYQVTPTGERPFALFRIQQAKSALRHESYIQTTVQVSQALENFLTCLLFNHDPSLDDSEYQSFYHLIDRIGKNDLMSAIDVEKIEDLRRIRNELVHTNTDQSIPEHFENIQEESNFVISDFDEMIETAEEIIDSYSG